MVTMMIEHCELNEDDGRNTVDWRSHDVHHCATTTTSAVGHASSMGTTKKRDTSPMRLIQCRLQSVTALAAMDMTEDKCIRDTYFSVRDGYKQLTESMLEVKKLVGTLPRCPANDEVLEVSHERSHVVESTNNSITTTPPDEFVEYSDTSLRLGFAEMSIYTNRDFVDGPSLDLSSRDKRKSVVSSPTDTSYTYRTDDSLENDAFDSSGWYVQDNSMPFFFTLPPPKGRSNNEDSRSLLCKTTMCRRTYSCHRTRCLFRYALPRLVCTPSVR